MACMDRKEQHMNDEIFNKMGERAYKRQSENSYFIGKFPHLSDIDQRTLLGGFSWFTPSAHIRYLDPLNTVNIGLGEQTQPEIARDYLMVKYGGSPKIRRNQLDELTRLRKAPLFCLPGHYPDMVYLDLKAAYWSIIRIVGWDVDYMPGKWITYRSDNEDFPDPTLKVARSALVSLTQAQNLSVWTGERLTTEKTGSNLLNSALWACVFDVLNGVAEDMVKAGAVYCHTDGYILPRTKLDEALYRVGEWGLVASIRYEGDAEVKAAGAYRIGKHQTHQRVPISPHPIAKIDGRYADWLRPRIKWLSRLRVDRLGVVLG